MSPVKSLAPAPLSGSHQPWRCSIWRMYASLSAMRCGLQALEQRAGIVGRIVIGLVGMAWALVTMLVLPVLVIEQVGA